VFSFFGIFVFDVAYLLRNFLIAENDMCIFLNNHGQ